MTNPSYDPLDPHLNTHGGRAFRYLTFDSRSFSIEDIAHALSRLPRWNGHTAGCWPVAAHCLRVEEHVANLSPNTRLWALLHDAAEAYTGDIPSPLKDILMVRGQPFRKFEEGILFSIASAFGLPWPIPEEVHRADAYQLRLESARFLDPTLDMSSAAAEAAFLQRFHDLRRLR